MHFYEGLPDLTDTVYDGSELTVLISDDFISEIYQLFANV